MFQKSIYERWMTGIKRAQIRNGTSRTGCYVFAEFVKGLMGMVLLGVFWKVPNRRWVLGFRVGMMSVGKIFGGWWSTFLLYHVGPNIK